MGVDFRTETVEAGVPQYEDVRRARFGAYFPRLFAYAQASTGDDRRARDVVVEAFTRAFSQPEDLGDEEFRAVLFGLTRQLCHGGPHRRPGDRLSAREREVISLMFDGQLRRESRTRETWRTPVRGAPARTAARSLRWAVREPGKI